MSFLVDTCFISDIARRRPELIGWLSSVSASDIFVSVISMGELVRGIEMKRRRDETAAQHHELWLEDVRRTFAERILPVSGAVAAVWGSLSAQRTRPVTNTLIAATALVHGLTVVTRNVVDFVDTGVILVNPWTPAGTTPGTTPGPTPPPSAPAT